MRASAAQLIAVVDDDARVLEAIRDLLESAGLEVRSFSTGKAFLDSEAFERFDALISDLDMAQMGGLELQQAVAARRADLPVIMLSARGESEQRQRAIERGAQAFLQKPFDGAELLAILLPSYSGKGK